MKILFNEIKIPLSLLKIKLLFEKRFDANIKFSKNIITPVNSIARNKYRKYLRELLSSLLS